MIMLFYLCLCLLDHNPALHICLIRVHLCSRTTYCLPITFSTMPFDDFGDYFHDDENLPTIDEAGEAADEPAETSSSDAGIHDCGDDCGCAESLGEDTKG